MLSCLTHVFLGAVVCLNCSAADNLAGLAAKCLEAREGNALVRVLHFGDSHLAQAGNQRNFSEVFHGQFGDGGSGFGLPWVQPRLGLRVQASRGWRKGVGTAASGAPASLGGAWFEATHAGESAWVEGRFSRLRLHFLRRPGGGTVRLRLDGQTLGEVSLQGESEELVVFERELPAGPGPHKLEMATVADGPVRLLGLALEHHAGVVHSVVAFNGAQASWLMEVPETLFLAQVRAEAPDLVILAFGTNEANAREFERPLYQLSLEALLARFQQAAPRAALVLVGPPDAHLPRAVPGALEGVIELQRAAAERFGAFFVDQRQGMGGPGAINEWSQSGLAARDLVHFTPEGYRRLAHATLVQLFDQLEQRSPGREAVFSVPVDKPRKEASLQVRSLPGTPSVEHPIYVFKTEDGRTIITDDPATVSLERGDWIGRKPQ